jgi:hypothetical protein
MARHWPLIAILAFATLVTFGCRADDEVKRGAQGEFCDNVIDACRVGLSCVEGICQGGSSNLEYDCTDVCATLTGCGSLDSNCTQACLEATDTWSDRAVEEFGGCFANDITCEQASGDPQQLCYDQIEVPDGRAERCSLFAETVRDCDPEADTEQLRKSCFRTGRVGTDEAWNASQRCEDAVETGVCSGIGTCLNDVFGTSFNLPDSELNTEI